jgi:hypothetical protein
LGSTAPFFVGITSALNFSAARPRSGSIFVGVTSTPDVRVRALLIIAWSTAELLPVTVLSPL